MAETSDDRDAEHQRSGGLQQTPTEGEGHLVKGMPHLYYASGAARRTTWIGRTLVVGEDPHGVRRLYQDEDALPLPPDPEPVERRSPRLRFRRIFGAAAG